MPRNVAIVLERDYSVALEKLAFHTPVWIVDTPENRTAAEDAWRSAVEWPHIRVTLFRPLGDTPAKEDWTTLLEQIAFLERFESVDVIGSRLTPAAREALVDKGLAKFDDTATGFRAKRI